jgi:L-lactate dehydrogenase complex protein LldF
MAAREASAMDATDPGALAPIRSGHAISDPALGPRSPSAVGHGMSHRFKENAAVALADARLQEALAEMRSSFRGRHQAAARALPEFEALRDHAKAIKQHTLANLDYYLERFEAKVKEAGGQVHWCADAAEARKVVLAICRRAHARTVTKGKTMVGEEIALNAHLEAHGIVPVETDLGEYIIQLRGETPSHIIAPAIHVSKEGVADTFRAHHADLDPERPLGEITAMLAEARGRLRARFLAADVGITGANFLIAETGSSVIVTNEGNGDLTQIIPRVHIVLAGIEKVVPTLEDATAILRILARSATGQEMSVYTTLSTGPRRARDPDGPAEYHVVLLDNGRSAVLGTEFEDMLRCIRCGACMDHCPVYHAIGGHAYGSVYPGPIGAVLTPALFGLETAADLPNASTLCGRCESVCPMRIPLPKLLRRWRELSFERRLPPARERWALEAWAWLAQRPRLYRLATALAARLLRRPATGRIRRLPLGAGWTRTRDFPAPAGRTFQEQWRRRQRG